MHSHVVEHLQEDRAREGAGAVSSVSPYAVRQISYVARGSEVHPKVVHGFALGKASTKDFHFFQLALKS